MALHDITSSIESTGKISNLKVVLPLKSPGEYIEAVKACLSESEQNATLHASKDVRVVELCHLFELDYVKLWAIAYKRVRSKDAAYEAVSRTFLKMAEALETIRNLEHYSRTTVKNMAINILKEQQARKILVDLANNEYAHNPTNAPMSDRTFSTILDVVLLDLLTAEQAKAFSLHCIYDWPHEDIAEEMGISVGASKMLVNRAKTKLHEPESLRIIRLFLSDFDPDDGGGGGAILFYSKKKSKSNRANITVQSDIEPKINDLLRFVNGEELDGESEIKILKWLVTDEYAPEIISGLLRAIEDGVAKDILAHLQKDKDELRNRLFEMPSIEKQGNILSPIFSEVGNSIPAFVDCAPAEKECDTLEAKIFFVGRVDLSPIRPIYSITPSFLHVEMKIDCEPISIDGITIWELKNPIDNSIEKLRNLFIPVKEEITSSFKFNQANIWHGNIRRLQEERIDKFEGKEHLKEWRSACISMENLETIFASDKFAIKYNDSKYVQMSFKKSEYEFENMEDQNLAVHTESLIEEMQNQLMLKTSDMHTRFGLLLESMEIEAKKLGEYIGKFKVVPCGKEKHLMNAINRPIVAVYSGTSVNLIIITPDDNLEESRIGFQGLNNVLSADDHDNADWEIQYEDCKQLYQVVTDLCIDVQALYTQASAPIKEQLCKGHLNITMCEYLFEAQEKTISPSWMKRDSLGNIIANFFREADNSSVSFNPKAVAFDQINHSWKLLDGKQGSHLGRMNWIKNTFDCKA